MTETNRATLPVPAHALEVQKIVHLKEHESNVTNSEAAFQRETATEAAKFRLDWTDSAGGRGAAEALH